MATGAQPALEPQIEENAKSEPASEAKPLTRRERIIRKLTQIFEPNEDQGVTRF